MLRYESAPSREADATGHPVKEPMISQELLRPRNLVPDGAYPDSYWRSLFYFNVYRTIVATLLLITAHVFEDSVFGSRSGSLFLYTSFAYIAFSGLAFLP